jgi:hypothetical protein
MALRDIQDPLAPTRIARDVPVTVDLNGRDRACHQD